MSEFSRNLNASETGTRFATYEHTTIENYLDVSSFIPNAREYVVKATISNKILIDEAVLSDKVKYDYIINQAKHALIWHMFGEFRKPIYEIRLALFNRDFNKAEKLLSNLEHQLFN